MSSDNQKLIIHIPRRFTDKAWGGTERVLEQTLPLLNDYGFFSTIHTTQALDKAVLGQVANVPISRYQYFYPEWPLSKARKLRYDNKGGNLMSPSLAHSLREIDQPSIFHFHTGNLLAAHCLQIARQRNVPTVLTLHGGHFSIPDVELADLACTGKDNPRSGFRWGRLLSLALGTRQLLNKVDALICVGIEEYEAAKAALPTQDIYFLPGGVNLDEFNKADRIRGRERLGIDSDTKLIVCVARVDHQKDQDTLIRAWAQYCDIKCDLALVGAETSPGYIAALEKLAVGAPGKLHITGGITPSDIPHLYAAGDISVLPSRHEPFGLTCLESWAAGTVLVAAKVGGPAWLLEGEKHGRLFPPGDAFKLGEILRGLLLDDEQRKVLEVAGLKRVTEEFGWNIQAKRLSLIYQSILKKTSCK